MQAAVGLTKNFYFKLHLLLLLLTDSLVELDQRLKVDLLVDVDPVAVDLVLLGLGHRVSTPARQAQANLL